MMSKSSRSVRGAASTARIAELLRRGLQLHQSGRAVEAAPLYEQVLALDSNHPAANHLLGVVRLAEGSVDAAIRLIARAVSADGENAQYLGNLGVSFNAAERHRDALEVLRRAVALKPDFAEAHTNMGTALRGLRRFEAAADAHRDALRLKPREAGFHFNLGNALEDAGEVHEAEAAYREAIRLRPRHVGAMAGRSRVLKALRRYDEALEQAQLAVALAPDNPDAQMALGHALSQSSRLHEASSAYRRVIERDPDSGAAHFCLAYLTRYSSRDASFGEMERIFHDESLSRDSRTRAGFGLGKGLADIGEHASSVEVYRAANALRSLDVPFATREAITDMDELARDFASRPEGCGYGDYDPIFIVGLPRAGKTTLEAMLGGHPVLWGAGELSRLKRLVLDLGPAGTIRPGKVRLSQVADAQLRDLGERYSDYVRKLAPPGRRIIDTMPPNFMLVGFIRLAMPNARIIHCLRDPLEQCVAIFEKIFGRGGHGYSHDLRELAAYFGAYRRLMARWHGLFPGMIFDVDVAEVRKDPEVALRRLLDFCGLEWTSGVGAVTDSEPQLGIAAPELVAQRRRDQLDAYRPVLEPLLNRALGSDTAGLC